MKRRERVEVHTTPLCSLVSPISPTSLEVPLLSQSQSQLASNVGDPRFGDGSDRLFSMYLKIATEEDVEMVERWQNSCDSIIIFVSA